MNEKLKNDLINDLQKLYNGEDYHDQIIGKCIGAINKHFAKKQEEYITERNRVLKETAAAIEKRFGASVTIVGADNE